MPEQGPDVSRLADEVLADARRKAERRRKSAEREAAKHVAEARAAAEQEAAKVLDAARQAAERQRLLIRATEAHEIRRRRLARQGALLDALIQAGFDLVAARRNYDVRQVLMGLVLDALRQMAAGRAFEVAVNAADRRLVDAAFLSEASRRAAATGRPAPGLALDDAPAAIAGGVIVVDRENARMVDNSFEARRRRLEPELREALAALVFPQTEEKR
jgi:vacuolar-type H+-ATPase subunit E/Vma4